MNSLPLIVLTVLVLSFETFEAFPQHGVNLDSRALGGGAEAGAARLGEITAARAGALGGAAKSEGVGSVDGGVGLISASSGALGGMAQASAGTHAGVSGASVHSQGGRAQSGAEALGVDGGSTSAGAGANGGAAQAAADTAGDAGHASSGAIGGGADSGAGVHGEDGRSTNVGTGASGGVADAGVVQVGDEASVHSGAVGGGADSVAGLAGGDDAEGTPTPAEETTAAENEPAVGAEPVGKEEDDDDAGEGPVVEEKPAIGDNPGEIPSVAIADTPTVAIIGTPNGDDSPIEIIIPLPADNPNGEITDGEDSETLPAPTEFNFDDNPDPITIIKGIGKDKLRQSMLKLTFEISVISEQ
ncbi:hypothetical protein CBL_10302 [Carabus blaptoides fortunei]